MDDDRQKPASTDSHQSRKPYRPRVDGHCHQASATPVNHSSLNIPWTTTGTDYGNVQQQRYSNKRTWPPPQWKWSNFTNLNCHTETSDFVSSTPRYGGKLKRVPGDKRPTNRHRNKETHRPYSSAYVPLNKRNLDKNPPSSSGRKYNERSISRAPKLAGYLKNTITKLRSDQSAPNDKLKTEKTSPKNDADCVPKSSGDLNKLHEMTAIEFDRDRYARYGVHESEIKDEVRTTTFITCIELCAENYIKVNIKLYPKLITG